MHLLRWVATAACLLLPVSAVAQGCPGNPKACGNGTLNIMTLGTKLQLLPQGGAPTGLEDGDMWTTDAGLFARIAGATVGPFGNGGGNVSSSGTPTNGQIAQWTSSSTIQGITNTQLTADINVFSSTLSGAVPASGGGTTSFLRADGTWATPASGGTPGGTNGQVQFNNSGVFGGLTNAQLTADINAFSSTLSGAVPSSGGGTTNFLRADGTWAAPAGGGNVSSVGTPTNGQLAQWTGSSTIQGIALGNGVSGALGANVTGTGGMVLATGPTIAGLTVTGSLTATGLVTNGDLVNAATTVNGTTCTLGSPCTVTATASNTLTFGTHLTGTSYNGSAPITLGTDATSANTASTIMARDVSGNVTVSTLTGSVTGHASLDLALTGGTLTGKLNTLASATGGAGLNLPQGVAPTAPANGDVWTTPSGLFVQIAGATVGPLGIGGGSAFGSLTGGTNTSAAMVVGTGASLATTGSGTIAATSVPLGGVTGFGANVATALAIAPQTTGSFARQNGTIVAGNCLQWSASGIADAGAICGSGGTGITQLTGDVTAGPGSGSQAASVAKVNGVAYSPGPSTNTVPVVTGVNTTTYEAVPNAALANSSMTLAGHTVSLGGTQAFACGDLSNGASGCSTATGTSGATIPLLNGTNAWSGPQTFANSDLLLAGSSTGVTTFTSANAGASNFTITVPASAGTMTLLGNTVTGSGGTLVEATSPSIATPTFTGTVPSFTAATITAALTGHASQDLALSGGTLTGKLNTLASAAGGAGLNLPAGAAPTTPSNGDMWTTTSGLFVQINGGTVGPLAAAGGAPAFSSLTGGTNTTAAMVVGTGSSLSATGSGAITATAAPLAGITGAGAGVITFLTTPSSANLAATVTGETGSGALVFGTGPTIAGGALSGTFTGTPTFSGNLTFSGVPSFTGTLTGTQTQCLGLSSGNALVASAGACGSGGGSWTLTDGTHSVSSVTTETVGAGLVVGGSAGSATLNLSAPARTAATPTVATTDLAGTVYISSGGVTIPTSVFTAAGQTVLLVNYAGTASTLTNTSGLTLNAGGGCSTSIPAGYGWQIQYNGTSLDCLQVASASTGGTAFSALTGGTNTAAAMLVGTGASLAATGSGTITATAMAVGGLTGLGAGVGTFLTTPSSANLATAVTDETGSGALVFGTGPTIAGGALSGTFTGTPTFSGNLTFSGVPNFTGTLTGTQTQCLGLSSGNVLVASAGACGTGGSSLTVTDGTHSVSSTTSLTMGQGFVVSGSAGSATVNSSVASRTVTVSPTVASTDMGGIIYSNVTGGGTLTIPAISGSVFPAGSTLQVTNVSASTEAISTTPTVNAGGGCVTGTGIPAGATWLMSSNGTSIDCAQTVPSSSGGAVSSVSNSDTTLTISPTTGAVVASLNLAHANTWTGDQTLNGAGTGLSVANNATLGASSTNPIVTVGSSAATSGTNLQVSGPAGALRSLEFSTGVSFRWAAGAGSGAESGSNAGSNFFITRYDDTGTSIDNPFSITRATGLATFIDGVTVTGTYTGPGMTDAGAGVTIGGPTGGAKGTGTLNVQNGVYANGVLQTIVTPPSAGALAYYSTTGAQINGVAITANVLPKSGGTGAPSASSITDNLGVTIGSPTGGAQGAGTLNATGLFVNGVAVAGASGVGVQSGQAPSNIGDNATALPSGHYVYATNVAMTAARSHNLPDSATQGAGDIEVIDSQQTVTGTNTLTVAAAGTDTLNGVTNGTAVLSTAGAAVALHNDGSGHWTTTWFSNLPPTSANKFLATNASGAPTWSTLGTNVGTAMGNALSAAGGLTTTVASGTLALGTSAIASGACATVATATATGTATTDTVLASFNGDPTAVTGYIPSTSGMLAIITYPTANTFNAKVCNNTSASITPGAITLNWRVVR